MPTYEYKCLSCLKVFEVFQSMKDDPIRFCPDCNGGVKRLIGVGAGTIFKGSGFYQTDYKNASNSINDNKSEKSPNASEINAASGPGTQNKKKN